MEVLIGLGWFLGLVAAWAVLSGLFLIVKRCSIDPLFEVVANAWRESGIGEAWPWWI